MVDQEHDSFAWVDHPLVDLVSAHVVLPVRWLFEDVVPIA
jgi:hypothetical protein